MAGRRIDECTFAVVDVETTGIDASCGRVVEVSVLTCDWRGTVADRFETLVRPDDLGEAGTRAEMLTGAPGFAEVAGDILARLAGRVVAGHNVSFDLRFLDRELGRLGMRIPGHAYLCTRELATLLGCDVPNRTLAALCTYFGVPFGQWHTAAGDTAATAAVLAGLLARAADYGRMSLSSLESWWSGPGVEWPELPAGGRVLVRDVERWPPVGDQPGARRAREASFRRLGPGPVSPSGAVVTGDVPSEQASDGPATWLWWEGDFRGLAGIARLEETVVPAFRAEDDPELVAALVALADLLRRHGGRDAEVRATFEEAYDVAVRRRRWDLLDDLAGRWGDYLAGLRDTDGLVQLMLRCLDTPGCSWTVDPVDCVGARVVASAGAEPLVADRLTRGALAALIARRDHAAAWDMLAILMDALAGAGRQDEAMALADQAWADGCTSAPVLDRFSRGLEEAGAWGRATDVCARALAARPRSAQALRPADAACFDRIRKRHRRCQERLARAATLFG